MSTDKPFVHYRGVPVYKDITGFYWAEGGGYFDLHECTDDIDAYQKDAQRSEHFMSQE